MNEKIYKLKNGNEIIFKKYPHPRIGNAVVFTDEEWSYIRKQSFTDAHKEFLWHQKYRDFKYQIIPVPVLTEPVNLVRNIAEVISILKKEKNVKTKP